MRRFPTIVLGLGAMGSAAIYHLSRKGHKVFGIDRLSPPHTYGSTHGDTRVTRLAIGEGEHYTPLALRSHELWRELEQVCGRSLLTTNGGLIISSSAKVAHCHVDGFFANTLAAAETYGIAHEVLDAAEIPPTSPPEGIPSFPTRRSSDLGKRGPPRKHMASPTKCSTQPRSDGASRSSG